jgi:hypothetical protein
MEADQVKRLEACLGAVDSVFVNPKSNSIVHAEMRVRGVPFDADRD